MLTAKCIVSILQTDNIEHLLSAILYYTNYVLIALIAEWIVNLLSKLKAELSVFLLDFTTHFENQVSSNKHFNFNIFHTHIITDDLKVKILLKNQLNFNKTYLEMPYINFGYNIFPTS